MTLGIKQKTGGDEILGTSPRMTVGASIYDNVWDEDERTNSCPQQQPFGSGLPYYFVPQQPLGCDDGDH